MFSGSIQKLETLTELDLIKLSNLGPRSLQHAQSVSSSSSTLMVFHRTYTETSPPPNSSNRLPYKSIRLANTQIVTEFIQYGELPTFKKQGCRSTNNPWRRYGALRKLCETGGFAPNSGSRKERKNRDSLVAVKNVKLPPPPTSSQMTLNKVRDPGQYEIRLALKNPKNVTVDVAAQNLAEQVKVECERRENQYIFFLFFRHLFCIMDTSWSKMSNLFRMFKRNKLKFVPTNKYCISSCL
ncbi:hypothetical protein CRE_04709 [Caenorhabditis remanei]|uniref:Uncharacterized protein n=1 Tax=Caenorhabditis remanei TaxID=31234 RepID=E3LYU7_CAERE|nr:hypothetical protein CRE_04709 [Caenorhabditis remanei]